MAHADKREICQVAGKLVLCELKNQDCDLNFVFDSCVLSKAAHSSIIEERPSERGNIMLDEVHFDNRVLLEGPSPEGSLS